MDSALTLGVFAMLAGRDPIVTIAMSAGRDPIVIDAILAGRATIVTPAIQDCARMDTAARARMDSALLAVGAFAMLGGLARNAIGCTVMDALASMRQMWSFS
jgi:hypothetical protein